MEGDQAMRHSKLAIAIAVLGVVLLSGCHKSSGYNPVINPSDFVGKIDNPFSPMSPGQVYHYRTIIGSDSTADDLAVIAPTKSIMGVTCTIVWDRSYDVSDNLTEETFDWYAQDKHGNVWYFGEDAKEFAHGKVISTEGSWQAGVDDAKPGIVMPPNPVVGDTYRQEYSAGIAEDMTLILSTTESATVPYGSYTNCVKTQDWTPLHPNIIENKWFARGVGWVSMKMAQGGDERLELVSITTDSTQVRR
jgi:hypothetical protein